MHAKTRRELSKSYAVGLLLIFIWAFLIYWQGPISFQGFWGSVMLAFQFKFAEIADVYKSLLFDLVLLLVAGIGSISFFSIFALPVETKQELRQVIQLLPSVLTGQRLEAKLLHNGQDRNPDLGLPRSQQRSVLHLDAASAAVLRRGSSLTRALGPGFHISNRREAFAGGLDLRIQRRNSGPLPKENPFAPRGENEDQASFLARKARREESTALSKDGVEVVARIELLFQIEGRRGNQRNPFPFQAEFAWRALANEGVSPQSPSDLRERQVSWDWLPSQLAVDLWRIFLRKYTIRELFEELHINDQSSPQTGLRKIEDQINERLKNALVESSKGNQNSPEYQFLRNRGIRVLSASIREIYLAQHKEEARLVNDWSQDWEMKAIQKSFRDSEILEKGKAEGLQQAASHFIKMVSEDMLERLAITDGEVIQPPDEEETSRLLVASTIRKLEGTGLIDPVIHENLHAIALQIGGGPNAS